MMALLVFFCAFEALAAAVVAGDARGERPAFLLGGAGLLVAGVAFALGGPLAGLCVLVFSCVLPAAAFHYVQKGFGVKTLFREPARRFSALMPALVCLVIVFIMKRSVFEIFTRSAPASSSAGESAALPVLSGLVILCGAAAVSVALALLVGSRPGQQGDGK
ncbi:MAG: hypothetical protein PHW69_02360 [Elusimicrobiaceae bacterium]|nr:hypothetical protein [Elusimicrobiaceae bacterium]